MTALFLGVDGGQTGTQAVVADGEGRVLGRGAGGPSNHVEAPGGRERLRAAIVDSVTAALRASGLGTIATTRFAATYCAMTGEADFKTEVIAPLLQTEQLRVEHDAPAALAGATLGEAGVIAIAGTGSVVYGEDGHGGTARAGGWGYVFGDEGGAFGVAREGIRGALDALDEVGPPTTLVHVLSTRFAMDDLRLLPMVMYNGHLTRDAIADAARDVIDAWLAGDAVAGRVVASGVEALAGRVRTVAARVALHAPLVCTTGGLFQSTSYAEAFSQAVRRHVPHAMVTPARLGPDAGALLLAYRTANVPLTASLRAALVRSVGEATS